MLRASSSCFADWSYPVSGHSHCHEVRRVSYKEFHVPFISVGTCRIDGSQLSAFGILRDEMLALPH